MSVHRRKTDFVAPGIQGNCGKVEEEVVNNDDSLGMHDDTEVAARQEDACSKATRQNIHKMRSSWRCHIY